MQRWPKVVTQALWPYVVSIVVDIRNKYKLDKNRISSIEKLSSIKYSMNLKDNHTFRCPAFVFHTSLQDHHSLPRWDE